jgi:hypothetical protein
MKMGLHILFVTVGVLIGIWVLGMIPGVNGIVKTMLTPKA